MTKLQPWGMFLTITSGWLFLTCPVDAQNRQETTSSSGADVRLILLDVSADLMRPIAPGNRPAIEVLQEAVADSFGDVPGAAIGLRTFGGSDSAAGTLVVAPALNHERAVKKAIAAAKPGGERFSLFRAVQVATEDLANFSGDRSLVIISGGELDSELDAAPVIGELKRLNVAVEVVALGGDNSFAWLSDLALAANGHFHFGLDEKSAAKSIAAVSEGASTFSATVNSVATALMPADPADAAAKDFSEDVSPAPAAELVRVTPADIGPWRGKSNNAFDTGEGLPDAGVPVTSDKIAGTLEIIFDASNSMNAKMGGVPKIRLAKDAMYHLLDVLEGAPFQTGLRVFGHDQSISREDLSRACKNSELVVPIAKGNTGSMRSRIPGMEAWGRTPIAYSLEQAGEDLDAHLEDNPMVLLISDGVESCDGDPALVIDRLNQRGIKIQTHVIGFDLKPGEKAALQAIAAVGNGNYYDARNYGELIESLDRFARDVKAAEPPKPPAYLNPVQGGPSMAEAVEIGAGTYTLWDVLKKDEFVWFKVPTTKAQRVAVRATSQGRALSRDAGGKLQETALRNGAVNVAFVEKDRPERNFTTLLLGESNLAGDWIRIHYQDTTGEGTFFKVGSPYSESSPNVKLEVIVQEAGDLWVGHEAPDDPKSADLDDAPLGEPFYGHFGPPDKKDAYRIPLGDTPSDNLSVAIQFSDVDVPARFKLEFLDGDTGRRISRSRVTESGITVEVPTNGAKSIIMVVHDDNPKSILKVYMNSYEVTITPQ